MKLTFHADGHDLTVNLAKVTTLEAIEMRRAGLGELDEWVVRVARDARPEGQVTPLLAADRAIAAWLLWRQVRDPHAAIQTIARSLKLLDAPASAGALDASEAG